MNMTRKIMAVADARMQPSAALARAEALAERVDAAVHLVLVDYREGLAMRGGAADKHDERRRALEAYIAPRRAWLEAQAEGLRAKGIATTCAVVWGKPSHSEIVRQAHDVKAELVIKDVLVEPRLKTLVRPPEDWHLLRECPVPVLLVNEHASTWPRRIIAAVDPYDAHGKPHALNWRIVEAALELAKFCRAELRLVHVLDFMPIPVATMGAVVDSAFQRDFYEQLVAEHRRELIEFALQFGISADRTMLLEGRPDEAIASYAHATLGDMVVVGAVRREGLARFTAGCTSEAIIHRLHCDVLVVKPEALALSLWRELEATHADPLEAMEV